ncbi:MAG: LPS export ABC transporter periplasmic protein LptC [Rhizobiales bacterium]|nr:LPS export ABC transporter periplasmic protein LptC [Hyphomicrobiales bacterium]
MTQAADGFDDRFEASRAKAFAAAGRHTSRVRFLRGAIVAAAALGVLGLAAVAWLDPFRRLPEQVSLGSIGVSGSRVTMDLPKLSGFRRDSKPYDVTARSAVQDLKKPNVIELVELDARIAMADHGVGHVTARTGFYDSAKETMELRNDVRMKTDSGYEVQLGSALIDFKAGTLVSTDPVTALVRNSTIKADAMRVADGGKQLVFEGRVRTQILPENEQDAAAAQLKGTSP